MQAQESSVTSIDPPENPRTSQSFGNDADWLEHITLDSSDYIRSSSNFTLNVCHKSDPIDEDGALAAHLWDRQYASDPDQYEWDSDDLVSSASADDQSTYNEESPRLARKDEFEQGIRRDWTRTREYREQWEENHIFYKQKIQARLEAEDNEEYDRHSYVFEGAWSGQAEELDYGTPATSGGVGWSAESKEPWTVEDSWDEGKGGDEESCNSCEKLQREDSETNDEEGSTGVDMESGKQCLCEPSPGQRLASRRKGTHNSANRFSSLPRLSKSTRYTEPNITTFHDDDTALSSPPSSRTATTPLRNPARTSTFRDPEPMTIELALDSTPNDGKVLSSFLDTCIAKTQALLVNANEALNLVANVGDIFESDEDSLTEEKLQNSLSREATTETKPDHRVQTSRIPIRKADESTIAMHESYTEARSSQTRWPSNGKGPAIKDQATNETLATNETQALQALIAQVNRIELRGERLERRVQHLEKTLSSRSIETRDMPDAEEIVRVGRRWKFRGEKFWTEGDYLLHTQRG